MAFASVDVQLENRTKYLLTDSTRTATPSSIGADQSTFWIARSRFFGGAAIRVRFSIIDPDDGHVVGSVSTSCVVPLLGRNTYEMSPTGGGAVTAHDRGRNATVRFVLEGEEGAFVAKWKTSAARFTYMSL